MEASALFAFGKYYSIPIGSIFAISDVHAGDEWNPDFFGHSVQKSLENIFEVTLKTLGDKR
jgi:nucleoside phosphorylase